MTLPIILDSAGLDALASARPPVAFRALLAEAWERQREVIVPAVVCAEVCRTFDLARSVGAILARSRAGSSDIVSAHVVAIAARHGGGLVVTSDPEDISRLADTVPAARILTRPAR